MHVRFSYINRLLSTVSLAVWFGLSAAPAFAVSTWKDIAAIDTTGSTDGSVCTYNATGGTIVCATSGVGQWSNGTAGAIYYNGGNVGIGTTAPIAALDVAGTANFHATNTSGDAVNLTTDSWYGIYSAKTFSSSGRFSGFIGFSSRGTAAMPSYALNNDTLAEFQGRDAADVERWGGMSVMAAENHSTTAQGNYLSFTTTENGTIQPSEKLRISSNGYVGIGITPSVPLQVNGSGNALYVGDGTQTTNYMAFNGRGLFGYNNSGGYATIQGTVSKGIQFNVNSNTFGSGAAATIASSGNVGIGTASPTNLLSLGGDAARTIWMERGTVANTAGYALTLQSGGATSGATDKAGGDLVLSSGTSTGTGTSAITFKTFPAGSTGTTDNTATTAMTITGAGKVGIGTTAPSNALDIVSSNAYSPQILVKNTASDSTGPYWNTSKTRNGSAVQINDSLGAFNFLGADTAGTNRNAAQIAVNATDIGTGYVVGSFHFYTVSGSTYNDRMTISGPTGYIGIGTNSPAEKLHVSGNILGTFLDAINTGGVRIQDNAGAYTNHAYFANDASNNTIIGAGGATRMTILSSGNVGIGTSSPLQLLHLEKSGSGVQTLALLNGGTAGTAGSGGRIYLSGGNGTARSTYIEGINIGGANNAHALAFGTSPVASSPIERMRIDASGNVGIGTTAPAEKLEVAGNIKASGTLQVADTSGACSVAADVGKFRYNSSTGKFQVCK